jgi:MHS family proline/betaine transporter-like MFS transporter
LAGFFQSADHIRSRLSETGYQPEPDTAPKFPIKDAFVQNPRLMMVAMLFTAGYGVSFYLSMVFLPSFASAFGDISDAQALPINTVAQALALLLVPLSGWLTDHVVTRRTMLILAFCLTLLLAIPAFVLAHGGGVAGFWVAQIALGIAMSFVMGAEPAMMTEMFPSKYRLSGYSVAFNVGLGIAGGTAPIVVLGLIKLTGIKVAPSWYLMLGAAVAAGAIALIRDRSREPLR